MSISEKQTTIQMNDDKGRHHYDDHPDHEELDIDEEHHEEEFEEEEYTGRFPFYNTHRSLINHIITFLIITGLFIPACILHKEGNLLVLSLLYAAVVWWLLLQHLPVGSVSGPISAVWNGGAHVLEMLPPLGVKIIGYGVPPLALILTAALRADDMHGTRAQRLISCLGLVVLLGITVACSKVTQTNSSLTSLFCFVLFFLCFVLFVVVFNFPVRKGKYLHYFSRASTRGMKEKKRDSTVTNEKEEEQVKVEKENFSGADK